MDTPSLWWPVGRGKARQDAAGKARLRTIDKRLELHYVTVLSRHPGKSRGWRWRVKRTATDSSIVGCKTGSAPQPRRRDPVMSPESGGEGESVGVADSLSHLPDVAITGGQ